MIYFKSRKRLVVIVTTYWIINAQGVKLQSVLASEDNTIMFTDKYNTLWAYDGVSVIKVGDNILAQNVIGYGAKDNHISYLTIDGDLYLYDTDSLEETLILQDASDFSQIYMTNTKIYPYRSDGDEDTYNIKQIYD